MEEVSHGRDFIGFVDQPDGRSQVIETGAGYEVATPQLSRIPEAASAETGEVRLEALGQPSYGPSHAPHEVRTDVFAEQELARREQHGFRHRPGSALVGGVEGTKRLDLISEPLHPDRQRLTGWEYVEDAPAARELPTTTDLGHVFVAQVDERRHDSPHVQADPRRQRQRSDGEIGRCEGALE